MSDPIVPGYFCTICKTGFDKNDPKVPWAKHRLMPLNGLDLRVGEVFGYGASSPIPNRSMVVTTDPIVCPEYHERSYGFALILVNSVTPEREESIITASSQFRAEHVYEFDPKEYEIFLNAFGKLDGRFRRTLLTLIHTAEGRKDANILSQDELLSLPLPLARGTLIKNKF